MNVRVIASLDFELLYTRTSERFIPRSKMIRMRPIQIEPELEGERSLSKVTEFTEVTKCRSFSAGDRSPSPESPPQQHPFSHWHTAESCGIANRFFQWCRNRLQSHLCLQEEWVL